MAILMWMILVLMVLMVQLPALPASLRGLSGRYQRGLSVRWSCLPPELF